VITIFSVAKHWTDVTAQHFGETPLFTAAFRWEISYVTDLGRNSVDVAFQRQMGSELVAVVQNAADLIPQFALALQIVHISNHVKSLFSA
jgi:hypothetical protein